MASHVLRHDPHLILIGLSYQKQTTATRSRTRSWRDVTCRVFGRWKVDMIMFCFIHVSNSQGQSQINIKNKILDFVGIRKGIDTEVLGSSAGWLTRELERAYLDCF